VFHLLCFPEYGINEPHHRQPQKYWSLQELYMGCDFYSMVEDSYNHHPEEAEEMGLKIYQDDRVIDEMTKLEVLKCGKSSRGWMVESKWRGTRR